ncbi:dephospho-CoA kinase [Cyanobium sp. PCC 7001]|uniref:dephospho-CoA kinase n=1 Tax=Cyanobium sp. PCC 7001 TaxID=180281 RepID=UPI00018052F6|nr:dephospho-CoA kinase [Cyanobium sp. PCC 7001]
MDPADAEANAVCRRLAGELFPWDLTRALELALLKTFCLPSISSLLERTGEFTSRPRKRYDDTGLMVAELLRWGPGSAAGQAVIDRMNRIHGAYAIGQRDFLYVLSTFVAEPIRWLRRYGWRPLSAHEQTCLYRFWRQVGEHMGLQDIPGSLEALLTFNRQVEREAFRPAASNARVAEATLGMLLADWPEPLRPALRSVLLALVSAEVGGSLGWSASPGWLQRLVLQALRLRSRLAQRWPRRPGATRFYSERPTPGYGESFRLEQLGPPALLPRLNRPRWQGHQRRIGLTGGIASGKSTAGRWLADQAGLPLLDADHYAREALAPGSAGEAEVLQRYGAAVRPAEGTAQGIDRAELGRLVFHDPAERAWLEQLVHPQVRRRFEAELQRLAGEPAVVLMIPLLFEAGLEGLCSEVWLIDCDERQQLQRLMQRNQLDEAEARARISAQWPLQRKRPLADVVLDNRSGVEALEAGLAAALAKGTDGDRIGTPT